MAQVNSEIYIRDKFTPGTRGYMLRDSTGAYRPTTYSAFLRFVDDLRFVKGFNVSYVVAGKRGPTYKQNGKIYDCYDTFIIAYIKRNRYSVDKVVFYTVRKYVNRKLSIVRPNSKNSDYYKEMKKHYRLYKRM